VHERAIGVFLLEVEAVPTGPSRPTRLAFNPRRGVAKVTPSVCELADHHGVHRVVVATRIGPLAGQVAGPRL